MSVHVPLYQRILYGSPTAPEREEDATQLCDEVVKTRLLSCQPTRHTLSASSISVSISVRFGCIYILKLTGDFFRIEVR